MFHTNVKISVTPPYLDALLPALLALAAWYLILTWRVQVDIDIRSTLYKLHRHQVYKLHRQVEQARRAGVTRLRSKEELEKQEEQKEVVKPS